MYKMRDNHFISHIAQVQSIIAKIQKHTNCLLTDRPLRAAHDGTQQETTDPRTRSRTTMSNCSAGVSGRRLERFEARSTAMAREERLDESLCEGHRVGLRLLCGRDLYHPRVARELDVAPLIVGAPTSAARAASSVQATQIGVLAAEKG